MNLMAYAMWLLSGMIEDKSKLTRQNSDHTFSKVPYGDLRQ